MFENKVYWFELYLFLQRRRLPETSFLVITVNGVQVPVSSVQGAGDKMQSGRSQMSATAPVRCARLLCSCLWKWGKFLRPLRLLRQEDGGQWRQHWQQQRRQRGRGRRGRRLLVASSRGRASESVDGGVAANWTFARRALRRNGGSSSWESSAFSSLQKKEDAAAVALLAARKRQLVQLQRRSLRVSQRRESWRGRGRCQRRERRVLRRRVPVDARFESFPAFGWASRRRMAGAGRLLRIAHLCFRF